MASYTQIYYQIVFSTKYRRHTISEAHCDELYKYICGIAKNKKCKILSVNGVEDHIHIFTDLHPTVALSDYVRDIKSYSSKWMKESGKFPDFEAWQVGYSGFTYSIHEKQKIINYVRKQKEHHKKESSLDELKRLFKENGIDFNEQDLE
jgi:putative transposase